MTKIIFLIPTLSIGGGERVVSELSLNLPESVERTIILFKNEISYPYKGKIASIDINFSSKNIFVKIYRYFLGLLKFRRIVKKEKPDYIISFSHPANIINILSGARAIVRVEGFLSKSCYDLGGKIYKFFVKRFFNRAHMVIDVSKESARDLLEKFGLKEGKIKVIYNPLNLSEIKKLSKEPLEMKYREIFKNPVIINMGRLTKQKGQQLLLEAFKDIKKKVKDAKLVILGQGDLEKSLKNLSKKMDIDKDIYFLGWQKNPFKFLLRSKVFVLSSLWEGLPYALMEAMACSLPIVSFDCRSGPREILSPETDFSIEAKDIEYSKYGILVKSGDTNLLSQAVIKVLSSKNLQKKLKEDSKKRALDFDIKNIIKEWRFLENGKN
jgi:glycosyltransferase involved in cell wall biosynthesis